MKHYLLGFVIACAAVTSYLGIAKQTVTIAAADPPAVIMPKAMASTLPQMPTPQAATSSDVWDGYPLLERACSCESWGDPNKVPRQFNSDGSILWGQEKSPTGTIVIVKRDVGACQINTEAHASLISSLHLDVINSFADNVKFAKLLYNQNGMQPWVASESCWKE